MSTHRKRALELIVAGGLVGIGCAAGAPVAALAGIMGGVGGNWLHDFTREGVNRWASNWLTPVGALNTHLQQAYQRALKDTFAQLAESYLQTPEYAALQRENRARAKTIRDALREFAGQVDALFADQAALGNLIDEQAAPRLQKALIASPPDLTLARDVLREELHDALRPTAKAPPAPPPAPKLFGRDTFLGELAAAITKANAAGDRPLALTAPQALHGLPGVGKTAPSPKPWPITRWWPPHSLMVGPGSSWGRRRT